MEQHEQPLVTWGEIAAFCKVTKQTAKRWHRKFGMPIVRNPSGVPTVYPSILWSWLCALYEERKKRGTIEN